MNCPQCGGILKPVQPFMEYDWNCLRCGRGWKVREDGAWHALFAAGASWIPKGEVEEQQKRWQESEAPVSTEEKD